MKKIGIFYGSSTGSTAKVARSLGQLLGVDPNDIHDVERAAPAAMGEYDVLLLGSSTWGAGELQPDWKDFSKALEAMNLKGKKIAVFGCGNQKMAKTFCNAVGIIYDIASGTEADMIGNFNSDGYTFRESKAKLDDQGMMKGLVLDEGNDPQFTPKRLKAWAELVKQSID